LRIKEYANETDGKCVTNFPEGTY